MATLNKQKPYLEVHGGTTVWFIQDGMDFDAAGNQVSDGSSDHPARTAHGPIEPVKVAPIVVPAKESPGKTLAEVFADEEGPKITVIGKVEPEPDIEERMDIKVRNSKDFLSKKEIKTTLIEKGIKFRRNAKRDELLKTLRENI